MINYSSFMYPQLQTNEQQEELQICRCNVDPSLQGVRI